MLSLHITSVFRKRYLLLYISMKNCFLTSGIPEAITAAQWLQKVKTGRSVLVLNRNQLLVIPSDWCKNNRAINFFCLSNFIKKLFISNMEFSSEIICKLLFSSALVRSKCQHNSEV